MQKIFVGKLTKGLENFYLSFNNDNNSFQSLVNSYVWRGRVKRKRGTTQLNRLSRYFDSTSTAFNPGTTTQTLSSGAGNLITGFANSGIQANSSIVPGTVTINDVTASKTYTDPASDGILVGAPSGSGTINYATGAFTIASGASDTVNAAFEYYPDLPVMGLEAWTDPSTAFPGTIAFDTTYSYNINTTYSYKIFNISFYENPATGTYSGYTQKSTWTPLKWNGQDYQQFWSTNYENAFWATNGVTVPFSTTNVGMQYKAIGVTTVLTATTASLAITNHGLVVGDFVFVNEVDVVTGINYQTGYVTTVTNANLVTVTFPNATLAAGPGTTGIAQYLTSNSDTTKDCIRFYNGTPTTGAIPPVFQTNKGWVNFCPPLSLGAAPIEDLPSAQYYLVGAKVILQFKDRLLFFGPVVQTSAAGSQRYLQDTIIYSQNGTPYYTASFAYSTENPKISVLVAATFNPILVPTNETAQPQAFFDNATGFGGNITAGYDNPIQSVVNNEDVLIVGFTNRQTMLIYTQNDLIPFNFFVINSELGSINPFSAITLDRGSMALGPNGIILTSQRSAQRVDLEIPDEVFQVNLQNNGPQRVTSQRDFINEWIYFTYSSSNMSSTSYFPNQTLIYNYREETWGTFFESYTTYGQFRKSTGQTWDDLTEFTWDEWNDPWDSGEQTLLQPEVIAGNTQGFVMVRSEGTGEDPSGYIQAISASSVVTSPNHNLQEGDYIIITGALGTIADNVNDLIFSVANPSQNAFTLNPTVDTGTYLGGGVFTKMYVPFIQSSQFPVSWSMGNKTRLGAQQYLLTTTSQGQVTLLIFLSQNENSPYNIGPIVPNPASLNNGLVYSTVLYTCPESTNIGLTPANTNLQMPTASQQGQIWHRMNTSLIGDTVQIAITMNDEQMRTITYDDDDNPIYPYQFSEIELHAFIIQVSQSQVLA